MSDGYVILNDVQFNKRDWQNRCLSTFNGTQQLISVPIKKTHQKEIIKNIEIFDFSDFRTLLKKFLLHTYRSSKHWDWINNFTEEVISKEYVFLEQLDNAITLSLLDKIQPNKSIVKSSDLHISFTNASDRLLKICMKLNAEAYISDSGGSNYLDETIFENVDIFWQDWKEPKCSTSSTAFRNLCFLDFVAFYGIDELKKHLLYEQNLMEKKPIYHV